jgi:hypothetical protein
MSFELMSRRAGRGHDGHRGRVLGPVALCRAVAQLGQLAKDAYTDYTF